jgi:hypothetical protein
LTLIAPHMKAHLTLSVAIMAMAFMAGEPRTPVASA